MQSVIQRLVFALIPALLAATSLTGQEIPRGPSYQVDLSDAINHYVTISMEITPTGNQTELMMATWTPGSYLVREYAKHVDRISATNEAGEMAILKTKKNRWVIETPDAGPVTVTYRIFCKESSVRTNFADRTHCVLNGAATFITVPAQMDMPHFVTLKLPKVWEKSATSLRSIKGGKNRYRADNYDELVDSPIVAGNVELFQFEVADVPHYLVNVNDEGNWNGERAARDLARIVEAHHELWGCVPYDRYYFLNVINDSGGGLEHDNCCLVMTSQTSFRDKNSYLGWLSLCSHEFFHTWNIRRLRPKSLVDYDYESEVYTPSLWVAEGVTSYYEDLLLVRAGLMSPAAFVNGTSGLIRRVQGRKGRRVQSLRDSSHDAWIKYYRPEENSRDTQVSYYNKGAVAAFLLDIEIRNASGGKRNLDDALRQLYELHAGNVGYKPDDFRRICSEVAGADLNDWFSSTIDSTDELMFQNVADWLGMKVGPLLPSNASDDDEPAERPQAPWIGIGEPDSPATLAGIDDSDEILAINGQRLTGNLRTVMRDFKVGDELTILLARDDEIMEVELSVEGIAPDPRWNLANWDGADDLQRVNRHNWLFAAHEGPEFVRPRKQKWTKVKKLPLQ